MAEAPYTRPRVPSVEADGAEPGAAAVTREDEAPAPVLSWAEQEVLNALKRLARAQSQLQALEGQGGPARRSFDAADGERLEALEIDLAQARAKASGRFAKGTARERVDELEVSERLLLDHLGVATFAEYQTMSEAPASADTVDPAVLAFARQELASAQQAWLEVQALETPDAPPTDSPADEAAEARPADEAAEARPADGHPADVA